MIKKIILFADSKVGLKVLEFLKNNYSKDIFKVIINKDLKIREFCSNNEIDYEEYISDESIINFINTNKIDLGILAWWPKIISKALLNSPKYGFINMHNSYLPFNRGKHPYFWTFIEGNPYGVTIHKVDEGIDTGDIINQKLIKYDWEDNAGTIYEKSLIEIVQLFEETYPLIKVKGLKSSIQSNKGTFHLGKELEIKSEIILDKKYTARQLFNLIRARTSSSSFPSSFFKEGNQKYRVKIFIEKDNN